MRFGWELHRSIGRTEFFQPCEFQLHGTKASHPQNPPQMPKNRPAKSHIFGNVDHFSFFHAPSWLYHNSGRIVSVFFCANLNPFKPQRQHGPHCPCCEVFRGAHTRQQRSDGRRAFNMCPYQDRLQQIVIHAERPSRTTRGRRDSD